MFYACKRQYLQMAATLLLAVASCFSFASEVTLEKASAAAGKWARNTANLHGMSIGSTVKSARPFALGGTNLFNVVQMEGGGFVITSTDTNITPIIAFSESEDFVASKDNPLLALLTADMPERIRLVRAERSGMHRAGATSAGSTIMEYDGVQLDMQTAAEDWADLLDDSGIAKSGASGDSAKAGAVSSLSDTRVAPLVESRWSQGGIGNKPVYNYYTEFNGARYVCGCVATAFSQVMRYHRYPTSSLKKEKFECEVTDIETPLYTIPGVFDWDNMPLAPYSVNETQQRAIGMLTYNVGVASHMSYNRENSGGSGAVISDASNALNGYFGYKSAKAYMYKDALNYVGDAILSNLDYSKPVCLGIFYYVNGEKEARYGHCVVADGYGYNQKACYIHLNLGWGGQDDAWYNFPSVNTSNYDFNQLRQIAYNIFPNETGEIISGRVLNPSGTKISSATVVVKNSSGAQIKSTTSNSKGIWAVVVPSDATYTVSATSGGMSGERKVSVGRSSSLSIGNRWGQDITVKTPEVVTYTVSFDANGGNGTMSSQKFDHGVAKALTANGFVRLGHTFAGWSKSPTGTVTYKNRENIAPVENMKLYAVWHRNNYTLTCDANGGVKSGPTTYTMTYDSIVNSSIGTATRSGDWLFKGWWTEKIGGEQVFDSDGKSVSGFYWTTSGKWFYNDDLTIYAHWEEDLSMRTYTVSFNANGGSGSMVSQTFRHGISQALSKNAFARSKYTFVGWTIVPNGDVVYSDGQSVVVSTDLALYAKWEENQPIWTIGSNGYLESVDLNGLTDIKIPETVRRIGNSAFYCLRTLNSVVIPASVESIAPYAFAGCSSLRSIVVPDSVEYIGEYAFIGCSQLQTVEICDGVKTIQGAAFRDCTALKSLKLGSGIVRMETDFYGDGVFEGCTALENVFLADGIATIGDHAFEGCSNLRTIDIPGSVVEIGAYAFDGCYALTSARLGEGIKNIGKCAFGWCDSLSYVEMPNSITNIEDYAFAYTAVRNIAFGDNLKGIGASAFERAKIVRLEIPDCVVHIGAGAFNLCDDLVEIVVGDGNGCYSVSGGLLYDKNQTELIYCPYGLGVTRLVLMNTVNRIGDNAFYCHRELKEVVIPNGVASIGKEAFSGCTGITKMVLPDSVTEIGASAFSRCTNLVDFAMSKGVSVLGDNTFERCSGLTQLPLTGNTREVGWRCFSHCDGLKDISIPDGVTTIRPWAFGWCSGLENIYIPDSVREINFSVFEACSNLVSVVVPQSVDTLVGDVFYDCRGLETVFLPLSFKNMELLLGDSSPVIYYYDCNLLTVEYDVDGVKEGLQRFVPNIPTRLRKVSIGNDGFVFVGWATSPNGEVVYADGDMATFNTDTTLYAKWKPVHKVVFDANGGVGSMPDQEFVEGEAKKLRENAFSKTGAHFVGWTTSAGYDISYGDSESLMLNEGQVLFAKWEADTYRVSFGKNGGSGGDSYVTAAYGKPMPTPRTAPKKVGYVFEGYWDTTKEGGKQYYDGEMKGVRAWDKTTATTLWAKWGKAVSVRVTFGKNGGTGGDNYVTATYGKPMPTPRTAPKKVGYVFEGYWDTTKEGGKQYYDANMGSVRNFDKSAAVTLWAKWTPANFKVTFGKNGGTGGDNYVTCTTGKPMPTPRTAPKRAGWTFGGYWDTLAQDANGNPKGKQYYDKDMKSVRNFDRTAAITLWAKWTVKVTLGKNGGSGGDSYVTVTYNQPFPKRTMPKRTGYAFGGYWVSSSKKTGQCYNADGTGTSTMKWTIGGTPTVWALWTKTGSCVELPAGIASSIVATSAASDASGTGLTPAGLYSGVLADGSGAFWLTLDEPLEGASRTAYLYVASEDGTLAAECTVEESGGLLILTTEDGETFAVDPLEEIAFISSFDDEQHKPKGTLR